MTVDALNRAKRETELLRRLRVWLRNRRLYPAGPGHAWAIYGRRYSRSMARAALTELRALRPPERTTALARRVARTA